MRVLVLALLLVAVYARHEGYQGWKTYVLQPTTQQELEAVRALRYPLELDFLSYPNLQREGVVLVKPQYIEILNKALEKIGAHYKIHSEDVKACLQGPYKNGLDIIVSGEYIIHFGFADDTVVIVEEMENLNTMFSDLGGDFQRGSLDIDDMRIEERKNFTARTGSRQLPYDNYHNLDVIDAYLEDVVSRYPKVATLVRPAKSFEGRDIQYVKISTTNFEDHSKPVIIIDGGIHAREWISPPTVTWAIHKLLEDVTEPDLLENFDWVLLPVANPDGYAYTHNYGSSGRFWRKTRSTDQNVLSAWCPGVDGNRNYDIHWNTVGTSSNPCADTYAGGSAFSEIETRVVRDIIQEHLHRTALYLTMHSYGSMILYPWGHDGSLSNNALALHTVGIAMADAINKMSLPSFPPYVVGNSVLVIGYPAAGASEDYAHSVGVPLAYTYELPGLSGGLEGFNLPPQYIEQTCRETWEGIVAGARRAGELYQGVIAP